MRIMHGHANGLRSMSLGSSLVARMVQGTLKGRGNPRTSHMKWQSMGSHFPI